MVAAPLARGSMDYRGIAERDVYDTLADVERRFPIDTDRVYLTGISMGGAAALRLALTRPDLWAAIAAVCPAALTGVDDLAPNCVRPADPAVPRRSGSDRSRGEFAGVAAAASRRGRRRRSTSNILGCGTTRGTLPIAAAGSSSGSITFSAIASPNACGW